MRSTPSGPAWSGFSPKRQERAPSRLGWGSFCPSKWMFAWFPGSRFGLWGAAARRAVHCARPWGRRPGAPCTVPVRGCGGPARHPPLCRGGQWPPGAGKVPPCGGRSPSGGCLPGRGKVHFFFCGKRNGPSLLVGAKSAPLRFRLTAKTPFRFLAPPLPTKAALLWGPRARSSVSSGWNTAACVFTHCLGTTPGRYGHHAQEQRQPVVLSWGRLLVPLSGQSAAVPCVGRGALLCGARRLGAPSPCVGAASGRPPPAGAALVTGVQLLIVQVWMIL